MKLRLSLGIRRALTACLGMLSFSFCASAEMVTLTDTPLIWDESNAPGYTGRLEDSYTARNIDWQMSGGSYSGAGIVLESSHLQNRGTIDYRQGATGISLDKDSSLENHGKIMIRDGSLSGDAITNTDTIMMSGGGISSQGLLNSGRITLASSSCGLWGSMTNEKGAVVDFRVSGESAPRGIYGDVTNFGRMYLSAVATHDTSRTLEGHIVNHGELEVVAGNTSSWLLGGANGMAYGSLSNTGTMSFEVTGGYLDTTAIMQTPLDNAGQLTILAEGNGQTCGIYMGEESLTNTGTLEIEATSMAASETSKSCSGISSYGLIDNSGSINVSVSGAAPLSGISASQILNGGTISVLASGETSSASGLAVFDLLVNQAGGVIKAQAAEQGGEVALGITTASDSSRILNAGTLQSDRIGIGGTLYLLHDSESAAFTEKTVQRVSGTGAVYLGGSLGEGDSVAAREGGSVIRIGSGLSLATSGVHLVDDVTLAMSGGLSIVPGVEWNGRSLTVANGASFNRVELGTGLAGSWDGSLAVSSSDGGASHTLTQKSASQRVELTCGVLRDSVIAAADMMLAGSKDAAVVLEDSRVTIEGGAGLMSHVRVEGASRIAGVGESVTLSLEEATLVLGRENAEVLPMSRTGEALSDEPLLTLSTDLLQNVNLSGNLTLDFSHFADDWNRSGSGAVALTFGEGVGLEGLELVQASFDGVHYSRGSLADGVALFNMNDTYLIPEPATATLCLLALAGLALRRRR